MDLDSNYEVTRAAEFILSRSFTRVALQFPDELLKDSTKVVSALTTRLRSLKEANGGEQKQIGLFVMADTTYGSCCVDEVGASHVDADCVIHYGQTCLSPTSNLPAFFVFGKASINIPSCLENLLSLSSTNDKPIVVLYGLEYTHAVPHIREELVKSSRSCGPKSKGNIHFADVMCSTLSLSEDHRNSKGVLGILGG